MNEQTYFQQGDEIFKVIESLPLKRKKRTNGIIIKSPVTGHAHRVSEGSLLVADGKLYVRGPARVVHEEHKDIVLPKGFYECGTVMEYDHLTEESRKVID